MSENLNSCELKGVLAACSSENVTITMADADMQELSDQQAIQEKNIDLDLRDLVGEKAMKNQKEGRQAVLPKQKAQVSYKAKLTGQEQPSFERNFEEQMREWLLEEKDNIPNMSEDQRKIFDALPRMSLPDDRLRELCKPWKDAVIISLLGRRTNLRMMRDRVAWLLKSENFELIDLPNNYYVFRSNYLSLCKKLLFEGPWVIQGHYLAVQRWSPNFKPYGNKVKKLAIWVRIPNLPMHCYTEQCLLELRNLIGKALKVDLNTLAQCSDNKLMVERGRFARVSVEVDLNKQLQSKIVIRSTVYTIEYEGLDIICFKCGMYGHNSEGCLTYEVKKTSLGSNDSSPEKMASPESQEKSSLTASSMPEVAVEEMYGDWMKATRTFRQRKLNLDLEKRKTTRMVADNNTTDKQEGMAQGSRFDILQENDIPSVLYGKKGQNKSKSITTEWKRKEHYEYSLNRSKENDGNISRTSGKQKRSDDIGQKDKKEANSSMENIRYSNGGTKERARRDVECKSLTIDFSKQKVEGEKQVGPGQENQLEFQAQFAVEIEEDGTRKNNIETNQDEATIDPNYNAQSTGPVHLIPGKGGRRKEVTILKRTSTIRPRIPAAASKRKHTTRAHNVVMGSVQSMGSLNLEQVNIIQQKNIHVISKEQNQNTGEKSSNLFNDGSHLISSKEGETSNSLENQMTSPHIVNQHLTASQEGSRHPLDLNEFTELGYETADDVEQMQGDTLTMELSHSAQ